MDPKTKSVRRLCRVAQFAVCGLGKKYFLVVSNSKSHLRDFMSPEQVTIINFFF